MSDHPALFDRTSVRWGLRGDPVLWDALQIHFDQSGLPDSSAAFETALTTRIEGLIGCSLADAPRRIPVRAFFSENGGMSSGMVDRDVWRNSLIPLLLGRYRDRTSTH